MGKSNVSQTRTLEQLDDNEKSQVEQRAVLLDYINPTTLIQFDSENTKKIVDISTKAIVEFQQNHFEESQEVFTNFIKDLETLNQENILENKKKRGIFSRFLKKRKKEVKQVIRILTEQVSISKSIDQIEDIIVMTKLELMNDIEFCSQIIQKIYDCAKNQEIDYITIQESLKKAKQEKKHFEELLKQKPNNIEYTCKLTELDQAINRLEKAAYNLLEFRKVTLQLISQIDLVQSGDMAIISKINDIIINIIPPWKEKFDDTIIVYLFNKIETIENMINPITKKSQKEEIENLNEILFKKASEVERISQNTLNNVNKNLQENLNNLTIISKEVESVKQNAIRKLERIKSISLEMQTSLRWEDKNEQKS